MYYFIPQTSYSTFLISQDFGKDYSSRDSSA